MFFEREMVFLMNGERGREKREVGSNSKTNFSLCCVCFSYHFPVNMFNKARLDVNKFNSGWLFEFEAKSYYSNNCDSSLQLCKRFYDITYILFSVTE